MEQTHKNEAICQDAMGHQVHVIRELEGIVGIFLFAILVV